MAKILISPSKYLQGAGEMKNIGTYAAKCGKKALVLPGRRQTDRNNDRRKLCGKRLQRCF